MFFLLLNLELNESVVVVVDNLFGCSTRSSFKSKSENLLPAFSPFYLLVSLSGSSFSLEVISVLMTQRFSSPSEVEKVTIN